MQIKTADGRSVFVGSCGCKQNDDEIVEIVFPDRHEVFLLSNAIALRDALTNAIEDTSHG